MKDKLSRLDIDENKNTSEVALDSSEVGEAGVASPTTTTPQESPPSGGATYGVYDPTPSPTPTPTPLDISTLTSSGLVYE